MVANPLGMPLMEIALQLFRIHPVLECQMTFEAHPYQGCEDGLGQRSIE